MSETAAHDRDDPLEPVLEELSRRLAGGEGGSPAPLDGAIDVAAVRTKLSFWARRLSWLDRLASPEDWFGVLCSHLLQIVRRVQVVRNLTALMHVMLRSCVGDARRTISRGAFHKRTGVSIRPTGEDFDARSDAEHADQSEEFTIFLRVDLEQCVLRQIEKAFAKPVQDVLIALCVQGRSQVDVARTFGQTEPWVSRVKSKHLPVLQRLVRERCLGDDV